MCPSHDTMYCTKKISLFSPFFRGKAYLHFSRWHYSKWMHLLLSVFTGNDSFEWGKIYYVAFCLQLKWSGFSLVGVFTFLSFPHMLSFMLLRAIVCVLHFSSFLIDDFKVGNSYFLYLNKHTKLFSIYIVTIYISI